MKRLYSPFVASLPFLRLLTTEFCSRAAYSLLYGVALYPIVQLY